MRIALLTIALFQAASAIAQPRVGAEVSSDPLPAGASFGIAAPGVAIARDHAGVAISWVMADATGARKIYVARLDATAHFTGSVREIPVYSIAEPGAGVDATYPSIAASPDGKGFTLGWLECPYYSDHPSSIPSVWRAVYSRLDADLNPSRPALILDSVNSPLIVRSGKETWLTVAGYLWRMGADGSLAVPLFPDLTASDMAAAADFPQVVASQKEQQSSFTCTCNGGRLSWFCPESCKAYQYQYLFTVRFIDVYSVFAAAAFPSVSDHSFVAFDADPAVQADDQEVLIAWYQRQQADGGEVVAARLKPTTSTGDASASIADPLVLGTFGPDSGHVRPDIATDGQRFVVVWRSTSASADHDILGASITPDGIVTPVTIATSPADERDPSVIALGNGAFLVAYEKFSGAERRIAGRIVTFDNRVRTVR
ncbi:MAG TPA: hypothetical protein VLC46_02415 [Thermoanaerobaculia bacterium]|jgi:hypothetical protein|nr:hypothetical protein [Thermoanaerobaculia bacterium]